MALSGLPKRLWKQSLAFGVLFAVVFSLVAMAQVIFAQRQANQQEVMALKAAANDVITQVYPGTWDPTGYRQSDFQDSNYIILTHQRLLFDFEGFVRGFVADAEPVDSDIYKTPKLVRTDVGETWLIAGRKLKGGQVVAGISNPDEVRDPEAILRATLSKFGHTLGEAIKVKSRAVNQQVDYAILDDSGGLQDVQTGFPLRVRLALPEDYQLGTLFHRTIDGVPYVMYTMSILDPSGNAVGTVLTFDDISGQTQVLAQQRSFDFLVALAAWLFTALGAALYVVLREYRRRQQELSVEDALRMGEGQTVEFKEGIDAARKQDELARTIAAFANTNAGNIFVGIKDRPVGVVGASATTPEELDNIQKRIRDVAVQKIAPPVRVHVACLDYQGKKVVRIFVPRGGAPGYFVDNQLYIRDLTSVSQAQSGDLPMILRSFARMGA